MRERIVCCLHYRLHLDIRVALYDESFAAWRQYAANLKVCERNGRVYEHRRLRQDYVPDYVSIVIGLALNHTHHLLAFKCMLAC
jgi:hypothetical protein